MKYSPIELLPDWLRAIEKNLTPEYVETKKQVIYKLISNNSADFWLDVIRLSLDIQPKEPHHRETIINEIKATDINFSLLKNEHAIKTLASICLCFKLKESSTKLHNLISIALENILFLGQYSADNNIPFIEFAREQTLNPVNHDRKIDLEEINRNIELIEKEEEEEEEEEEEDDDDDDDDDEEDEEEEDGQEKKFYISATFKSMLQAHKVLSEESNILWWLFGEYSNLYQKHFKEIGPIPMVFGGAKELAYLTKFSKGLPSADAILNKAISLSITDISLPKTIKVFESINEIPDNAKEEILRGIDQPSDFTPCLNAIRLALSNGTQGWDVAFSKANNSGDINQEFHPFKLSKQIYNELIFSRLKESL